ncbi:MAG: TonB-dependent receptor, partial [Chitinispirillaceae bacterium]|nr:TonB-dependent receptor [Chitinispirillaceae bacterium]
VAGKNGQLPNPDLKPESGIGVDGGIDLNLPLSFSCGVRGFYSLLKDAIVENRVSENPSQTQSINAGGASTIGGEIELSQKFNKFFSWFTNFTYLKTRIMNEKDADQDGAEIPFSPNYIANLGLTYSSPWETQITPALNYNSGYYDATSKSNRKFFKPGIVINMYISQKIITQKQYSVECFGELYNITNNKYEMPWQFKDTGFSGMGGIKIQF